MNVREVPRGGPAEAGDVQGPPLEPSIAMVLRSGALVAVLLVVAGLVAVGVLGTGTLSLSVPSSPPQVASWPGWGPALLFAGILVLVLTPVLRVALTVVLFAARRDRVYTTITLAVFLLLLSSVVSGIYR